MKKQEYLKKILNLFLFILLLLFLYFPLPYHVTIGGGLSDLSEHITIEDKKIDQGHYNMAFVRSVDGTPFFYLIGKINPFWEVEKITDYALDETETIKELNDRGKLDLKISTMNAKYNALKAAKKDYEVVNQRYVYYYILEEYRKELTIGDTFLSYDGIEKIDLEEFKAYILSKEVGDKITLKFKTSNKVIEKEVLVRMEDGEKRIGFMFYEIFDLKSEESLDLEFDKNDQGPSAGLILTLALYDSIMGIEREAVVGSGVIMDNGQLLAVGGLKYKIKAAEKKKIKYFLISNDNLEEAEEIVKTNQYKIKIISADTFEELIKKLDQ